MWIVSFEELGALSLSAADQKSKEDIITVNIIILLSYPKRHLHVYIHLHICTQFVVSMINDVGASYVCTVK